MGQAGKRRQPAESDSIRTGPVNYQKCTSHFTNRTLGALRPTTAATAGPECMPTRIFTTCPPARILVLCVAVAVAVAHATGARVVVSTPEHRGRALPSIVC